MSNSDFNVQPMPYFTKVRKTPRKPLSDKPFSRCLEEYAEAIDRIVIEDVRFALTGEETQTQGCPLE